MVVSEIEALHAAYVQLNAARQRAYRSWRMAVDREGTLRKEREANARRRAKVKARPKDDWAA